jgi:hypothetical protein
LEAGAGSDSEALGKICFDPLHSLNYTPSVLRRICYLEKGIDEAMPGGKMPDETGTVQSHVAALGTGKGDIFSQQRRHLILKIYSTGNYFTEKNYR